MGCSVLFAVPQMFELYSTVILGYFWVCSGSRILADVTVKKQKNSCLGEKKYEDHIPGIMHLN